MLLYLMLRPDMTEAATPPAKKRRWRKPPSHVDNDVKNERECNKVAITNDLTNYLHPEMLSDADLVSKLNEYHVPVDSSYSRDQLVELFSKHVMPKPQRKRKRGQYEVNKYALCICH